MVQYFLLLFLLLLLLLAKVPVSRFRRLPQQQCRNNNPFNNCSILPKVHQLLPTVVMTSNKPKAARTTVTANNPNLPTFGIPRHPSPYSYPDATRLPSSFKLSCFEDRNHCARRRHNWMDVTSSSAYPNALTGVDYHHKGLTNPEHYHHRTEAITQTARNLDERVRNDSQDSFTKYELLDNNNSVAIARHHDEPIRFRWDQLVVDCMYNCFGKYPVTTVTMPAFS